MKTDTVNEIMAILERCEMTDVRSSDLYADEYQQGYECGRVDFAYARARQAVLALCIVGEKDP